MPQLWFYLLEVSTSWVIKVACVASVRRAQLFVYNYETKCPVLSISFICLTSFSFVLHLKLQRNIKGYRASVITLKETEMQPVSKVFFILCHLNIIIIRLRVIHLSVYQNWINKTLECQTRWSKECWVSLFPASERSPTCYSVSWLFVEYSCSRLFANYISKHLKCVDLCVCMSPRTRLQSGLTASDQVRPKIESGSLLENGNRKSNLCCP